MFASVVVFQEPSSSYGSEALAQALLSEQGMMLVSFFLAMTWKALGSVNDVNDEQEEEAQPTRAAFVSSSGSMFGLPI